MKKRLVVIGFIGSTLDFVGKGSKRWDRWRPTISLCHQPSLTIDRLELLHDMHSKRLVERTRDDLHLLSPNTEVRAHFNPLKNPWDFEEVYTSLHDFVRQYPFDPVNEEYLVHITTGTHVAQICWYLLTESRHIPGRLIQTSPAKQDDQPAAMGKYEIIDLDLTRYAKIAHRFKEEQAQTFAQLKAGIATQNPVFNQMIEQIEQIAGKSRAPILLTGPTGAGKSFLAKQIFQLKQQRQRLSGKLIAVNCATLRGDSAMPALFGHIKGSFTGALQNRPGLLKAADGGVLFLDEIGELGLDEQAMLLKAIEEKRFYPFGSDHETTSDFQLIAGTNRDLLSEVAAGRFREDLLARINLWSYELPGLAQRKEDIAPNLAFELARVSQELGEQVRFHTEAKQRYLAFATHPSAKWLGNFRELGASITRMATLAEQGRITERIVETEVTRMQKQWHRPMTDLASIYLKDAAEALDEFDRIQLNGVLRVCESAGSLSDAGRQLFAVSRTQKKQANDADRLKKYLAKFGLDWERIHPSI